MAGTVTGIGAGSFRRWPSGPQYLIRGSHGRVRDVREQVGDQHEHGEHEGDPHDDREVAAVHRVDEPQAESGPGEHRLGDRRAPDQLGKRQADDRDDRDEGVPEGVAEHDRSRRQALGLGRGDVLRIDDVEHRRPRVPHEDRDVAEAQDQRRQGEVAREVPGVERDGRRRIPPIGTSPSVSPNRYRPPIPQERGGRDPEERHPGEPEVGPRSTGGARTACRAGCRPRMPMTSAVSISSTRGQKARPHVLVHRLAGDRGVAEVALEGLSRSSGGTGSGAAGRGPAPRRSPRTRRCAPARDACRPRRRSPGAKAIRQKTMTVIPSRIGIAIRIRAQDLVRRRPP